MAIPPRQPVLATGGVNAALNVSAGGRRAIQDREGYRDHFYDDVARNCSFGVGTLVHMGPCCSRRNNPGEFDGGNKPLRRYGSKRCA